MGILAVSPLDGRYKKHTTEMIRFFSEFGLMRYRVFVEISYLKALEENEQIGVRSFNEQERQILEKITCISVEDAKLIKQIEEDGAFGLPPTRHDVKAVEYFIKNKLQKTSLKDVTEWVHFGLTSEDINNVSYALIIRDSICTVLLPVLEDLFDEINYFSLIYKSCPILARTHGQPASPSTFGKEFKVFSERLMRQIKILRKTQILAKLNGATGNYNAHYAAYPQVNWIDFSKKFINNFNSKTKSIKIDANLFTTQIESQDSFIEIFDCLRRINSILIDLSQDVWRYISDGWLKQKIVSGEIGSSTMPHKVNPIDFENAEGNLGLANSLLNFFSQKLPISRLQRDLSNSTVLRNIGPSFSYSLIAYKSLLKGISKISVDEDVVSEELSKHPEVITEAIQTILRREGISNAYEELKKISRGKQKITLYSLHLFVSDLCIDEEIKKEIKNIIPANYIGIADRLAELN